MFLDHIKVKLVAGKGGNGVIAWRREKFLPKGGPCGGDGGRGGSILLQANGQLSSLEWFHRRTLLKAEGGHQGGSNGSRGRRGQDLILKVPLGTVVKDIATGEILHDFTQEGESWQACQGGHGGRGNESFKSPTHQAPAICTPGTLGESKDLELELKIIAEVGLVGFPNAGKSSLLAALTSAWVKIAPYPFTTLHPNLGSLREDSGRRLVIADIPGLINGASENRGLGFRFLRHIERTRLLVFVLDASGWEERTAVDDFEALRKELGAYNEDLLKKPYLVVLNKTDLEESASQVTAFRERYPDLATSTFLVSALKKEGLKPLVDALATTNSSC